MEFLVRGATQYDEPGVFMAFEETAEELAQNVVALGFDLKALSTRKKIHVDYVHVEPSEIEDTGDYDLEGLFIRLGDAIDSIGAKRVVLDTIETLFNSVRRHDFLNDKPGEWLYSKDQKKFVQHEPGISMEKSMNKTAEPPARYLTIKDLFVSLEEAEETLHAIHSGDVDALVVGGPEGERVITLQDADHHYRILMEQIQESALTVAGDGTILYCNNRLADMLKTSSKTLLGASIHDFILPNDQAAFQALLQQGQNSSGDGEISLHAADGTLVPVHIIATAAQLHAVAGICLVLAELTEQKRVQETARLLREITIAVEQTASLEAALAVMLGRICQAIDWPLAEAWMPQTESPVLECHRGWYSGSERLQKFIEASKGATLLPGMGMIGRVWASKQPLWVKDVSVDKDFRRAPLAAELGLKTGVSIPVLTGDRVVAVIALYQLKARPEDPGLIAFLSGLAAHLGPVIQRKRAEEEIQKLHKSLERRIIERTAQLQAVNQKLEQELNERRKNETLLAAEKERLAITLQSIGDGVITTDTEGRIVLMNSVAQYLTGWSEQAAFGKPLPEVFHIVHEKTRTPRENPVEKTLRAGGVTEIANPTLLIAKDGAERMIADSGAPIRDKNNNIAGIVLVFRDVTEKQRLEDELIKSQKLESIGVLAGGIAHDFNNILTAILGNVALAKMYTQGGDKIHELLNEAEKSFWRARDLTQQLLTFAKGGAPIKKPAVLNDVIQDTTRFALAGANVRAEFVLPPDLWSAEYDAGQISQVIKNLVINAAQAMPEGGTLKVRAENIVLNPNAPVPLPPGRYVKLSFKDQGAGIAPQHLAKVFDPYFTTKQHGSGLGLATTYSIIKRHGGCINAESTVGVGTVFTVYLPASQR